MDGNQLLASQAHHLLFLVLICGIWSDFGTFGGGQSAWGGSSFSRQPASFENPVDAKNENGSWVIFAGSQLLLTTLNKVHVVLVLANTTVYVQDDP